MKNQTKQQSKIKIINNVNQEKEVIQEELNKDFSNFNEISHANELTLSKNKEEDGKGKGSNSILEKNDFSQYKFNHLKKHEEEESIHQLITRKIIKITSSSNNKDNSKNIKRKDSDFQYYDELTSFNFHQYPHPSSSSTFTSSHGYIMKTPLINKVNKTTKFSNSTNTQNTTHFKTNFHIISKPYSRKHVDYTELIINNLKTKNKCKKIQEVIKLKSSLGSKIFHCVKHRLLELICHTFGNYAIQAIIPTLERKEISEFLSLISSEIIQLSTNKFSSRAIQKLIEHLKTPELKLAFISSYPRNCIIILIFNKYGNHVLKTLFSQTKDLELSSFHETFIKYLDDIVQDVYGSIVIQFFLTSCETWFRELIISNLINNISKYIAHPYANYVILYCVNNTPQYFNDKILDFSEGWFIEYCLNKHSCKIIEQAMIKSSKEKMNYFIEKICNNEEMITKLLFSIYGNHILHIVYNFLFKDSQKKALISVFKKFKIQLKEELIYGNTFLSILNLHESKLSK